MGIVSPVSGTVSVPFPMNVAILCVWFIGVKPVFVASYSQTSCDDNSIPPLDDGENVIVAADVVVVVSLVVVVAPPVVVVICC